MAAGLLLILAGVWLLLQTVAGGLPGRLLELGRGDDRDGGDEGGPSA